MKNILFTTHLDDNFIDGALVMLYSMKKNVKDFMEYPIRIMHSTTIAGISQENQNKLKKLIPHIEFKDINKKEYIEAPVQYPKHRTAFLSLECFKNTKYDKVFFFDCDMLCIDDITEGIINAPDDMVSGCGGSPKDINCGLFVVGKKWLNDDIYHKMVNNINKHGVTRLFTQHMINDIVPEFNLLPDGYNWKVAPNTDLSRITQGYDVKRETKIIHWAGALPDKNSRVRPPYPKPWQDNEDSNPVTKLWYKYKKEMLNELKL
tara:strand:- start:135 stop:920 length:786 start_codon:yes stop_codon:yes gene_type:complete